MLNLFLDDERFPIGDDWNIVRSYEEAVEFVLKNGLPDVISFDHDLGTEKTGYDFAKWLVEYIMDNDLPVFHFFVHSQNPVGKRNIEEYLNGFFSHRKEVIL
jgi:hypothetical protein